MADDQDNGQGEHDEPELTLEQAKAKLKEHQASIAKLEKASQTASREAKQLREEKQAREAAENARKRSEQPEAERWEQERRELQATNERLQREREQERQDRIRDRQDIQIRDAITRMPEAGPKIDVEFADVVCWKIDREMFELDDSGRIVGGLTQALAKVARENPKYLSQKPTPKGSGPINRGGQGQQQNREPRNPFDEPTSYGT